MEMIGVFLDPDIKKLVYKIASIKGVSISEYARSLILDDLDKRTLFTTLLKEVA
jgi:hypothetical protein